MKAIGLPPENSLDIAVVIPAYSEGQDVVHMLASIADQRKIGNLKVGIFVVVNNARDAAREVLASNEATMDLLLHLQSDLVPDGLSSRSRILRLLDGWNQIAAYPSKQSDAEKVAVSGAQIALIDLSSDGHAPEICNVGLARDTGMKLAIPCTKDNGILISTDADSMLGEDYIRSAYDLLAKDRYAAVTGPVLLYSFVDQPLQQVRCQTITQAEEMLGSIMFFWRERNVMHTMERKRVPGLAGSNTAIKRAEYISSGGIQHINGAEDTNLGLSLLRQGKEICADGNLQVFTDARESDRAEVGCSMGQHMIKRAQQCMDDQEDLKLKNPAAFVMGDLLARTVDAANMRNFSEGQWKETVNNYASDGDFGYVSLSDEELHDLWELKEKEPLLVSLDKNHFLAKYIYNLSEKKWPPVPISQCVNTVADMLMEKEDDSAMKCYSKMIAFIEDEIRFYRLLRRETMKFPKEKGGWKGATKNEMRAVHKIPGTPEEEKDMEGRLLLMAQLSIADALYHEQLDRKSEEKIEKTVEEGVITKIEGDILMQALRKIQQKRMDANLLSFQALLISQHQLIFRKHLPHMSPEAKEAARQLQSAFTETAKLFPEGWNVLKMSGLKRNVSYALISEERDEEHGSMKDMRDIIRGISERHHAIDAALSWAVGLKFEYNTKSAKIILRMKDGLMRLLEL